MTSSIAVIQTCVPALRRYASALLRDRDKADDLVRDCLVRALNRLHIGQEDGDIRTWLFAIMHDLLASRPRGVNLRGAVQTPYDKDLVAPSGRADRDDGVSRQDLMRAIDPLPKDQRSVLLLVAVEDLSYAETARVLGVPIDIVMSQLSLAREQVRQSLSDLRTPTLRRFK